MDDVDVDSQTNSLILLQIRSEAEGVWLWPSNSFKKIRTKLFCVYSAFPFQTLPSFAVPVLHNSERGRSLFHFCSLAKEGEAFITRPWSQKRCKQNIEGSVSGKLETLQHSVLVSSAIAHTLTCWVSLLHNS